MADVNLKIAIQPPSEVCTGQVIYPPPTISVQTVRQSNGTTSNEFSRLWAFVTLIGESGEILHDQIAGTIVDTAHPFVEDGESSSQEKNYFVFSNLCIHAPGDYLIHIAVMGMNIAEPSGAQCVSTLSQIKTRRIRVSASGPIYSSPAHEEEALLNVLRESSDELPHTS